MDRREIELFYREIQTRFSGAIEDVDGSEEFAIDPWQRPGGGGGESRVLSGGRVIEKAAVNFSAVEGDTPPQLSEQVAGESSSFYATGISIIVHPRNPYAPTFHANLRYFETDAGEAWFGGGADLTPHYLFEEDAVRFHSVLKEACDAHAGVADYAAWKKRCDEYFFLPHRGEARGIGGLFFDHLTERLDRVWEFQQHLARRLEDAYLPILDRRMNTEFGDRENEWQEIRRGRYAEFNLVWDRGTRFGLETSGRVESILASLPPRASWVYDHVPEPGTPEEDLLDMVRSTPRSWV